MRTKILSPRLTSNFLTSHLQPHCRCITATITTTTTTTFLFAFGAVASFYNLSSFCAPPRCLEASRLVVGRAVEVPDEVRGLRAVAIRRLFHLRPSLRPFKRPLQTVRGAGQRSPRRHARRCPAFGAPSAWPLTLGRSVSGPTSTSPAGTVTERAKSATR